MNSFTRAATTYDGAAEFQRIAAIALAGKLQTLNLQPKTVLDIGCGTGLLTEKLCALYPHANITALDNNAAMLAQLRGKNLPVIIQQGDAYKPDIANNSINVLMSSLTLHWLQNQAETVQRWQRLLRPNGTGLVLTASKNSFPEWQHYDARDNLSDITAFSALPGISVSAEKYPITYKNRWAFLQQFKRTGTSAAAPGYQRLSVTELRALQHDTPPFTATWELLWLTLNPL